MRDGLCLSALLVFTADLLFSASSPQDEKERESERREGGEREREILCVFACVRF